MPQAEEKKQRAYRLPPCPVYDVEGTESWLSDLAREGLLLEEDGYFAGFMSFEKTAPRNAQYRMEAIQKVGILSDGTEHPSEEALELSEKYGWEYVLRYGEFHVYRSFDSDVREMNTDPHIQALALNAVRKRLRSSAVWSILWLVLFLFFGFDQQPVTAALSLGSPLVALLLAVIIWAGIDQLVTFLRMQKLYRKLKRTGTLDHGKDWRKNARHHWAQKLIYFVLVLLIIVLGCSSCCESVMNEDEIPLKEFTGDPPFATIEDILPEATYTMTDIGFSNTVRQWSDPISPVNYAWSEYGQLVSEDLTLDGLVMVYYHEMVHPFFAQKLAREYQKDAMDSKYYHPMELQELDVDYAAAFNGNGPTVVLQKGNIVVCAKVHLSSETDVNAYQQWATAMTKMLQKSSDK